MEHETKGSTAGDAAETAAEATGTRDLAGPGAITPEALAAQFPLWRPPAQAGDAWITMREGPQEYHGPESLIMRTLSAATVGELAEKLRSQAHLDALTSAQLAAVWRGAAPSRARVGGSAMITIDEVRARHPGREIRRNGLTWEAVDPTGLLPPVESGRLDFLDAMLGGSDPVPRTGTADR